MTEWIVRPACPGDAETIAVFNERMAWETERKTLAPETIRAGVRAVLEDPRKGRYFVAVSANAPETVVGQLMHTWEWSDWRNGNVWWLQSVYVHESFRCRGVFRALLTHLLAEAERDAEVVGVRLYVERQNAAAQAVYQKLGFLDSGYLVLERMRSESRGDCH